MPRASSTPRNPLTSAAGAFTGQAWRLMTQLPAEVMMAAVAVREHSPRRRVSEGLAGLDAIAAGRISDSDLVRAVAAAIFAAPEPDPDRPVVADLYRVLADCRSVTALLCASADPADAAAYRHWVEQVAVRVCRAGRGGLAGLADPPERSFLAALAAALAPPG